MNLDVTELTPDKIQKIICSNFGNLAKIIGEAELVFYQAETKICWKAKVIIETKELAVGVVPGFAFILPR